MTALVLIGLAVAIFGLIALSRQRDSGAVVRSPRPQAPEIHLSLHYGVPVERGTAPLQWMGTESELKVGRFAIAKPLTYVSNGTPSDPDACCIDTSLKIGARVAELPGALGYWPQYARITPDQRANYLDWMSRGRRSPLNDIGYAFLFFYGLERRAIVDGKDLGPILKEVMALLRTYPVSRSFRQYLSNFVAYSCALHGLERLHPKSFESIFVGSITNHTEESVQVALAWLVKRNASLTASLAYHVVNRDSRSARSVVLRRIPEKHRELFEQRFAQMFPGGMALTPAAVDYRLSYHPASPTLLNIAASRQLATVAIPDVLGNELQFEPLLQLWSDCIGELKRASTHVGKGLDFTSREAFEALPEELREDLEHPDKAQWDAVLGEHGAPVKVPRVPVSKLAKLRGIEERKSLTKSQSNDLLAAARTMGYALVPDPHSLQRSYLWSEHVAVIASDTTLSEEDNNAYHAATLMLELGVGIAAADGEITRDEVVHVSHVIRDQFRLSAECARRLEVYRDMLIKAPPAMTGLGRRVKRILHPNERTMLGRFLIAVAAADGLIHDAEKVAIRRCYRAMGLSTDSADELICEIEGGSSAALKTPEKEEASRTDAECAPTIELNFALVESITRETQAVARIIGEAMDADVGEVEPGPNGEQQPPDEPMFTSSNKLAQTEELNPRYRPALEELLTRTEWLKDELDALARKHGLMASAMVDEINSWSDEVLGDYLIDGDGIYRIQQELVKQEV